MIYLKLFITFFEVGLFSVGGGYAALPIIQYQVTELNNWITLSDFSNILTISQITPGAISINCAIFVGMQISGFLGAIVSTLGFIMPSLTIVLLITFLYYKFNNLSVIKGVFSTLQPAVIGLIASACVSISIATFYFDNSEVLWFNNLDFIAIFLFVFSFFIIRKFKINPIFIMLASGFLGFIFYLIRHLVLTQT